jgi:hypothetical protein
MSPRNVLLVSFYDYLVGFNILGFDNIILNMLAMDLSKFESIKDINTRLYKLSNKIVNTDREILNHDHVFNLYRNYGARYFSIDLQKIPALDKIFKGLKQTLINLKWHKIEEHKLPMLTVDELKYYDLPPHFTLEQASKYINHWSRFLTKEHVPGVVSYNRNDVLGCCELFCFLEEQIMLRFNLKAQYDIDVLSASDSRIADIFIAKYYSDYTGIPYRDYKDLRTHRTRMNIGKVISPLIHFKSKEFNDLLVSLMSKTVSSTNEINYPVTFNGVTYDIKSGGLHSRDNPKIYFFPDGSFIIEDGDVGSYYPTLTKNMRVAPKHLDQEAFIEVTVIMMDERLAAKAVGDTVKANSLKITINVGMFGKFNFAYSFLFDTLCTLTITINGQLILLMLIERLAFAGIQNVSANTDGIVCIIPKDKYDLYHKICDDWAKEVNFIFEYTTYVKYARLDVNNYLTVKKKKDGSLDVKRKGALNQYLSTEDLKKGFNKPVIAKAVEEYLVHDIPVRDTILNETDIYMFCATQNMDESFDPVYRSVVNGKFVEENLQKTVRYYISNSGGVLLKKKGNKYTNVIKGHNVVVFNDYFDVESVKDYNIKYSYYIKEAQKLIDVIQSGVKGNKKKDVDRRSNQYVGNLFDQPNVDVAGFPVKEEGGWLIADADALIDISEYLDKGDTDDNDVEYEYRRTARKGEFDEVKFNSMYMEDKPFEDYTSTVDPYSSDLNTEDDLPF